MDTPWKTKQCWLVLDDFINSRNKSMKNAAVFPQEFGKPVLIPQNNMLMFLCLIITLSIQLLQTSHYE